MMNTDREIIIKEDGTTDDCPVPKKRRCRDADDAPDLTTTTERKEEEESVPGGNNETASEYTVIATTTEKKISNGDTVMETTTTTEQKILNVPGDDGEYTVETITTTTIDTTAEKDDEVRKVVFLIGPPCAGKTTLCEAIAKDENVYRVVSARSVIQKLADAGDTGAVDALTKGIMFDPTLVTREIGKEIRNGNPAVTVVVDGFPRVAENMTAWNRYVEETGFSIRCYGTVVLDVGREECERRAAKRYRVDDAVEVHRERLNHWDAVTKPLLCEMENVRFVRDPAKFWEAAEELLLLSGIE